MDLTIDFMKTRWTEFNKKYFEDCMTMPAFKISHAKQTLGRYSWKWINGKREETIYLSDYYICSEYDYCNTLLHEMVHQYILKKNLCPPCIQHGYHFHKIADRINRDGWKIQRCNSRIGFTPRVQKDIYHMCAFKSQNGRYFMFRYHLDHEAHFRRLVLRYSEAIWFTSTDAKKYDSYCQCRKAIRGQYISILTYRTLK